MGMSRSKFKNNLVQAIEAKDHAVSDEDMEKFLDLNYDEDSSITDWDYDDFSMFASDLCANWGNFWETVAGFGLHTPDDCEDSTVLYKMETEDGRYLIDEDIDMDYIHGNIQAGYDVTVYTANVPDDVDEEDDSIDWEWVEDYKA